MNDGETERMDDRVVEGGVLSVLVVHEPGSPHGAVSSALASHPRLHVIGEKPCDHSTLLAVDAVAPDVVVVDASSGSDPTGFRLAMSIKAALPSTGLVILVGPEDLAVLSRAPKRQSPRCSFLLKDSIADKATFAKVVEGAASGLVAIDPLVLQALQGPYRQLLERLTRDQLVALELLSSGYSDLVVAQKLALDDEETETLIESVYTDLHIPADPSIHRRVKAALVFLAETSSLRA